MIPQPPPGQGPIDPRQAFAPPPPNSGAPAQNWGPVAGAAQVPPTNPEPAQPTAPRQQQQQQFQPPPGLPRPGGFPPPGGPYPPPGYYPSPGGFLPPPPPPRRRGAGWVVLSILLLVALGISVLVNIALVAGDSSGGGGRGTQSTLVSGDSKQAIAIVPLEGVIDEREAARFERLMSRVEADHDVKALVLRINTPGGGVTASDEIYDRILKFKKRRDGIPVVVSMGGLATSGGYYAACAADHLVAEPTTLTANIGVLLPSLNYSELMKKYGVQDTTVVSSGAIYKEGGSSTRPPTTQSTEYLQSLADAMFARFKQVVKTGRGSSLKADIDKVADGRALTADEALSLGLIDEVGYLEQAWQYAAKSAKLNNPSIVRFQENPSLLDLLTAESRFKGLDASSHPQVTVDELLRDRLAPPRMMYLWQGK